MTGGSDGIGANIVKLLAEKGIKIAILDIQEPKYTSMHLLCLRNRKLLDVISTTPRG